jgi:hypothetical protein
MHEVQADQSIETVATVMCVLRADTLATEINNSLQTKTFGELRTAEKRISAPQCILECQKESVIHKSLL